MWIVARVAFPDFCQMNEAGLFELRIQEQWGDGSMTEVQIRTLKGETIALSNDILTALHSELHGSLCLPDEAGYDEARTIWNAMIKRGRGGLRKPGAQPSVGRDRQDRPEIPKGHPGA